MITGYPDGTFRPDAVINFSEAAKILVNAFEFLTHVGQCDGRLCPDTNTPDTAWYEKYIHVLDEKHAIPLSIFRFEQRLTRGDMAEMIYRLKKGITTAPSTTYKQLAFMKHCDALIGWGYGTCE